MWEMRCLKHPTKKVCSYYDYLREQINEKANECLDAGLINGICKFDLGKGNTTWDFESNFNDTWFERYIYVEADEDCYTDCNEQQESNGGKFQSMRAFLRSRNF